MLFLFLPLALCEPLPVFQSYSVDAFINQAGSHPVYILCLFKEPKNLNDTSAVFRRLITAIPVEMDPRLAILIDPSLQRRQLLYVSENKVRVAVNLSFAKMQVQYAESNRDGVNFGVRTRFHALMDIVNGGHPVPKEEREQLPHERKETEVWKEKYAESSFSERDMDSEVVEIISAKNEERAVIVKEALKLQEQIETLLAAKGEKRRELPNFDQVDPRKREKDDGDLPDPQVDDEDDLALDADSADVDLEDDDEAPVDARKMKPQGDDDEDNGEEEDVGTLRRTVEKVKKIWKTATGDTADEDGGKNGKGKANKRKVKRDKETEKESKVKKGQGTEKDTNKENKVKKDDETMKDSKKENKDKSEVATGTDNNKASTGKREEKTEKDGKKEEETKTEERPGTEKDGKKEEETKKDEEKEDKAKNEGKAGTEKSEDEKASGDVKKDMKEEGESTKTDSSDTEKKAEEKTQSQKDEPPAWRRRQLVEGIPKETTDKDHEDTTRTIPAWRRRMEEDKKDDKTGSGVEKDSKDTQQEDVPIPAWWRRKQEEESKSEAESSTTKKSTEESHSIPAWRRRMEEGEKKTDSQAESVTEQAPTPGWWRKKQDEESAKDKGVSSHEDVPSAKRTREDSLDATTTKTTRKTHRPIIGDNSEESQGSDWKDSVLHNVEKKLREKNLIKS